MRCLIVGENSSFLKGVTSSLSRHSSYEISASPFQGVPEKIALNRPDAVIVSLDAAAYSASVTELFTQLPQTLERDQYPILVGITPQVERARLIKYYNLGFELVETTPLDMELMIARLKAVVRRVGDDSLEAPHLLIKRESHNCFIKTRQGEILAFIKPTPIQFGILHCLMKNPQQVWSREQLENNLENNFPSAIRINENPRTIDASINRLRIRLKEQINRLPANWRIDSRYKHPFIHSEYGSGYYFLDCLQLDRERTNSSGQPVRQGGFKLYPDDRRPYPFNIENCTYALDSHE